MLVKTATRELKLIQSAALDSMTPLTATDTKGENITHKEAIDDTKATGGQFK